MSLQDSFLRFKQNQLEAQNLRSQLNFVCKLVKFCPTEISVWCSNFIKFIIMYPTS